MTMTATNGQSFARERGALAFTSLAQYGDVYFANSADTNSGVTANISGTSRSQPASTLMQAQSLCNAPTNLSTYADTVYVGAGHAENVVGAASAGVFTFSTPGVSYIGQGNGRLRPKLTFNNTASQINITGQGVSFTNIVFDFTGVDAIVAAIALNAADIAFYNCEFICNSATAGVIRGLYANTSGTPADRLIIQNCKFTGTQTNSGTTTTAQIDIEYGANVQLINNTMSGKCTQNILNATACLDWFIAGNLIHTYTGTKSIALNSATVAAGLGNQMVVASGTTPVVATGASWAGNKYTTEALSIGTPTAGPF